MADNTKQDSMNEKHDGATAPGGGEQNHEVMQRGAMRRISGPGASDFLAATGGLDLPGVDPSKGTSGLRQDSPMTDPKNLTPQLGEAHEPIPGERDPDNLTGSQTGTIGGGGFGAHNPSPNRATGMADATLHDRELEGGGSTRERNRKPGT